VQFRQADRSPGSVPDLAEIRPAQPPTLRPDEDEPVRLGIGETLQVVGELGHASPRRVPGITCTIDSTPTFMRARCIASAPSGGTNSPIELAMQIGAGGGEGAPCPRADPSGRQPRGKLPGPGQRAGLIAAIWIVYYLAFSVPS
jgi:hypothetical protein